MTGGSQLRSMKERAAVAADGLSTSHGVSLSDRQPAWRVTAQMMRSSVWWAAWSASKTICVSVAHRIVRRLQPAATIRFRSSRRSSCRSEEHTSELQSPDHLVCRLLLEKKKK